jgi:predicted AAA+ superfamily ATPase
MYVPRWIVHQIELSSHILPVTVLTGARQTGKSTLLANDPLFADYAYTTLDDYHTRDLAHANPTAFVSTAANMVIDEAQREPDVFLAVKEAVRKEKTRRFVLSGSANFLLLRSIQDSLAGRASYNVLRQPLHNEWTQGPEPRWLLDAFKGDFASLPPGPSLSQDLPSTLFTGFLPGIRDAAPELATAFWRSYMATHLERDLPDISAVASPMDYQAVVRRIAQTTGSLLEYRSVSDDTKVPETTVRRYISSMQKAYLVSLLPPAPLTRSTSVRRQWKPYLLDSGLTCTVLDVRTPASINDELRGHLFEGAVFMALQALSDLWDFSLSFVRTRRTELHEVDFVLEREGNEIAVEAKASDAVTLHDARHLQWMLDQTPTCHAGIIVYGGTTVHQLSRRIVAVPWTML